MLEWIPFLILPITAFLYAAVGHGGASGYLAIMALFSFSPEVMKPTALVMNLFVAGISFIFYWKSGVFKPKLFFLFAITSIPLAYFGGKFGIDAQLYKLILGVLLLFALARLIGIWPQVTTVKREPNVVLTLFIGGVIGFFSGLIGIGGGIILSPVIVLFNWGTMKEAAAISALFIWVNSAAGLLGQFTIGIEFYEHWYWFVLLTVVGGIMGAYIGSSKLNNKGVKNMLAIVLFFASIKLILF